MTGQIWWAAKEICKLTLGWLCGLGRKEEESE